MGPHSRDLSAPASDWNPDLSAPDHFDMIFLQGASSSQYNSQPAQPFSSSAGEYFPDFFARQAQHPPSVQAVGQIQVLGVPSVHTQTAAPPVDSVATNWNPGFEGLVGEETWFTGVAHSPVPAIPPPVPLSSPPESFPSNWVKIPQRSYIQGSKQSGFKPLEPIRFGTKDHPGINLGDALRKNFARLHGHDDPMLQGLSGSVSCRLLFPGYPDNGSSCQIHTQDWTKARKPIPRSKLAYEVAKKLDRYLTQLTRVTPDGTVDGRWEVGHGFMCIDNMFLPEVPHVPAPGNVN